MFVRLDHGHHGPGHTGICHRSLSQPDVAVARFQSIPDMTREDQRNNSQQQPLERWS